MMKKNRIVTRVKDKTGIAKSKNRSGDLNDLRAKYAQFAKNQKFLITTLINNHATMSAYSKSRLEVAKAINSLTVDTPLFKCAGDIPANAVGTTDGGGGVSDAVIAHDTRPASYAAIHLQLHKKNKMYLEKYTEHILNYATEWERILSTRITGHLKESEKLRVDLDHYAKKVDDMNKTMNKTMSKGKSINDAGVDKLKRNEQKLTQARAQYDRFVNDLCGFMEEVMERGWKDLHPLLVKMAQFDATLSNEEAVLLKGSMAGVTESLKGMGAKYPNLQAQGRLKELETWSLESLNKVNPSMRSDSPLMITHGGGENASYVTQLSGAGGEGIHAGLGGPSDGSEDYNNGGDYNNVGGGGVFGTGSSQVSRTNSFVSNAGSDSGGYGGGSERSRSGTGDSVGGGGYDWAAGAGAGGGTQRQASFRSAPTAGGLPPLNPPRQGSFNEPQRSHDMSPTSKMLSTMQAAAPPPSMDDIFGSPSGSHVGMPAPPSGMPPPPPSMPPPPPPQSSLSPNVSSLSLYDHGSSPLPPAPPSMYGVGCLSPQQSVTSHGTGNNPFGDAFGPGGGTPGGGSVHGTPMQGNPYGNMPPTQSNPFGAGGGASTNPFG